MRFGLDEYSKATLYRPVIFVSYWLDSLVPHNLLFMSHLTNVPLHVLVSLAALALSRQVLKSGRAALLGALLFAVTPLHTESVAWVSGRKDL